MRCEYRSDALIKMKLCSREASRLEFLIVNWLARIGPIFFQPKAVNLAIYQYGHMAPMFGLFSWMSLHVRHASQETLVSILSLFSWGAQVLEPKRPRFINRLVIMPFWYHFDVSWLEAISGRSMLMQKSASYMFSRRLLSCSFDLSVTDDWIHQLISRVMRIVLVKEHLFGRWGRCSQSRHHWNLDCLQIQSGFGRLI